MSDAVARQREPVEQEQHQTQQQQQTPGHVSTSQLDISNDKQQQTTGLVSIEIESDSLINRHRQDEEDGRQRDEEEILEEPIKTTYTQSLALVPQLKRLAKSCQSDIKPSMSSIRADLERIARKFRSSNH